MVSFNLKVFAKFGLCSNCSQKLDGCSLARARKIFATACQMLVLAKINTLLACSQMLAKTILYPSFHLEFSRHMPRVLPGELKEDILEALKRAECKTI